MQSASLARSGTPGVIAMEDLGCGVCHVIPGIIWPQSNVGPPLNGFGKGNFVAGVLRKDIANVAAFVRNATAYVANGAMPPITMTEQQAADIAAYLLSLE